MSDSKRTAVTNAGAFMGPDMMIPAPMNAQSQKETGKSEPEDDWKLPMGPIDEIEGHQEEPEPVAAGHSGLLHRLTHRG
jgi:hypothetical protein